MNKHNVLIAYFSHNGENYVDGDIVDLPVGNTEVVANKINQGIDSDLFKIETKVAYPKTYRATTLVAKDELSNNLRPDLLHNLENINDYDVIYLGYPNWWGTMPMAVVTFLESFDFSGKIIKPFCTHEGSGMGRSEMDIRSLCSNATVKAGLAIKGSQSIHSDRLINKWIDE